MANPIAFRRAIEAAREMDEREERTVTTKSPPTNTMISPVSTISRASVTDSCGT